MTHTYKACVRCGYCCRKAPCAFGQGTPCVYLTGDLPGDYACSIYDKIVVTRGTQVTPAFGAGCSSALFNTYREEAIQRRRQTDGGE